MSAISNKETNERKTKAARKAYAARKTSKNKNNNRDTVDKGMAKAVARLAMKDIDPKTHAPIMSVLQRQGRSRVAEITNSFACPEASESIRWTSSFTSNKTAVSQPWAKYDTKLIGESPSPGLAQLFLFRDLSRHTVILSKALHDGFYNAFLKSPGNDEPVANASWTGQQISDNQNVLVLAAPYWTCSSAWAIHGGIQMAGTPAGDSGTEDRYIWLDAGCLVTFSPNLSTGFSAGDSIDFFLNKFTPVGIKKATDKVTMTFPGGAVSLTVSESNYYSFGAEFIPVGAIIAPSAVFRISMGYDFMEDQVVYSHHTAPTLQQNLGSVKSSRMNALSGMFTNTTANIQRGGKVVGNTFGAGDAWQNYSTFDSCSLRQDSITMSADKGIYGFVKPASPEDFDLTAYWITNAAGTLLDSFYPIQPKSNFIGITLQVEVTAFSGYWSTNASIEYTTGNRFLDVETSQFQPDEFDEALNNLRQIPVWHENPTHLMQILAQAMNATNRVAKAINKGIPYVEMGLKNLGKGSRWVERNTRQMPF